MPAALNEYRIARGIIGAAKRESLGSVPNTTTAALSSRATRPLVQSNSKQLSLKVRNQTTTRNFSHSSSRFSETTPPSKKLVVKVDSTHPFAPFLGAFWDMVLRIEEFYGPNNSGLTLMRLL